MGPQQVGSLRSHWFHRCGQLSPERTYSGVLTSRPRQLPSIRWLLLGSERQGSRRQGGPAARHPSHSCLTHPEDIVDEESAQQDAASADVVQVQELHPIKGEGQAKEVVGNPVLGQVGATSALWAPPCPCHPVLPPLHQAPATHLPQQVPDTDDAAQAQAHQVLSVKIGRAHV